MIKRLILIVVVSQVTLVVSSPSLPLASQLEAIKQRLGEDPEPEVHYNAKDLIESQGYPFEEHHATTEDHYVLTIHRIPHGKHGDSVENETPKGSTPDWGRRRPAVFLQHGLLASSDDWVINFPNESLGFILADAGYDVWLGNIRGNKYNHNNTMFSSRDAKFWQFSFNDMAIYDLPAMVDYVAESTGQEQIYYVGHSQGTLLGFVQFSENITWAAKRIKQFHALAPIAHLNHISGGLRYIAPFTTVLSLFLRLVGDNQFLPSDAFMVWLADHACEKWPQRWLCKEIIISVAGFDNANINITRLPVYVAHTPAGTSTKDIVHFGQMIHSGRMQKYDYGYYGNWRRYGSLWPPLYHPELLEVPTVLYWGAKDILADMTDVARLQEEISPTLLDSYGFIDTDHLDFVWGLNAAKEIYPKLMALLKKSEAEDRLS